jgi:hypothetical protein
MQASSKNIRNLIWRGLSYAFFGGLLIISLRGRWQLFGYSTTDILGFLIFGSLISVFPLVLILQRVLGVTEGAYATVDRVAIWSNLSKIYQYPNNDDLIEIAKSLKTFGLKRAEVRKIIEAEVGPVCFATVVRTGKADWNREWLIEKILKWRRACQSVRSIPFLGYFFSRIVTRWKRLIIARIINELGD